MKKVWFEEFKQFDKIVNARDRKIQISYLTSNLQSLPLAVLILNQHPKPGKRDHSVVSHGKILLVSRVRYWRPYMFNLLENPVKITAALPRNKASSLLPLSLDNLPQIWQLILFLLFYSLPLDFPDVKAVHVCVVGVREFTM